MRLIQLIAATMAVALAMLGLDWTPAVLSAQNATPTTAEQVLPAHIHNGTCANLGDVAYPLNDVHLAPVGGTPVAAPNMMDTMHEEVLTSVTIVALPLEDLLEGNFAINVHASADDMNTFVACGDIEGTIRLHRRSDAPVGLVIPLRQLNDSGYGGMAWLSPTDDGKTEVTVFLATDFYALGLITGASGNQGSVARQDNPPCLGQGNPPCQEQGASQ